MAFAHGSQAVLKLGTVSQPTTPVDISQYLNSVTDSFSRDSAETTTFGKTAKTYIPGLKDGTISAEGRFDPTVDAQLYALFDQGTIVDFEYGPAGTSAGSPKYTGQCFVTSYEVETPVDDVGTFSLELQIVDNVTRSTY